MVPAPDVHFARGWGSKATGCWLSAVQSFVCEEKQCTCHSSAAQLDDGAIDVCVTAMLTPLAVLYTLRLQTHVCVVRVHPQH